jgi:hypothetical protein
MPVAAHRGRRHFRTNGRDVAKDAAKIILLEDLAVLNEVVIEDGVSLTS